MFPKLSKRSRLTIIIILSFVFFCAEISVGFYTRSMALIADAFHYLNDLLSYLLALLALTLSTRPPATSTSSSPPSSFSSTLSFGYARAPLLAAFFNAVFLLALGVSIFLQSVERFVALSKVEQPRWMLVMGGIGLGVNVVSADLGMMAVLLHVLADAVNNIGVMVAALAIWLGKWEGRYYADPGVSMGIALMILASSIPLVRNSGAILLQSAPAGVDPEDVKHDMETIPGISSVHELHIWRLNQKKSVASAHIVMSDPSMKDFMEKAKVVTECLHAYGIHSATLQPELAIQTQVDGVELVRAEDDSTGSMRLKIVETKLCQISCGNPCKELTCCG
ncbi:cation diffusion facilitator family metal ion transporter [Viridothelium virens]|uniref:Cation diffusion facilitator family metal ion transporter n=1 Tax=Viridothelium virens TaxID=1048519 RepID=A0A6A6GU65_VIRVR|nr:cation diffusion facilitator family metal ion transporter [Viridothelium virens]